jgi:voltage-gated potassium channel
MARPPRPVEIRAVPPPSAGRVAAAVGVLACLTILGAVGYHLVEGFGWRESVFMAVITLSTVGYSEVQPLSPAGQLFTICFIAVGLGATFYAVVALAEFLIAGHLGDLLGRRAMQRSIQALKGHVIICGFGRLGRAVAENLEYSGLPTLVVDPDPALETELAVKGTPCVVGSALEDTVLREAGIERARAIVAATPSDADNVFIALSSRELNPEIAIHARAETEAGRRRLRLAGATQVIALHGIGGQRIANAIVRPAVVDFIELSQPGGGVPIDLEEVVIGEGCQLATCRLRDLPERGLRVSVVAIKRAGEATILSPGADAELRPGDHVVVVGDQTNMRRLAGLAEASEAR